MLKKKKLREWEKLPTLWALLPNPTLMSYRIFAL